MSGDVADLISFEEGLRDGRSIAPSDLGLKSGLLPRQKIEVMIQRRMVWAVREFEPTQLQPASLDLRLGSKAYRVRASFLPGKGKSVAAQLAQLKSDEIALERGAVLERGCVYVVELMEHLHLPDSITAVANPKSSTGRLDVFTRLITDEGEAFDFVTGGYRGRLYAEISPRSFSIRVRSGSKLNQIRFRKMNSRHDDHTSFIIKDRDLKKIHDKTPLVDGLLSLRGGLILRIELSSVGNDQLIGYKAQTYTDVVDVDLVNEYKREHFWEPIKANPESRIILDPHRFYILVSKEKLHIPPGLAAEMIPIDPIMGEFRVHYAGFFDPGFGFTEHGFPGSRAVLEVRSHEVPFILEDGQMVGRLAYERLAEAPDSLYGQIGTSNYQGQELKLSKHFA